MFKWLLSIFLVVFHNGAMAQVMTASGLSELVRECAPQISPDTMLRLIDHESKGNMFVIGVNAKPAHKAYYPKSKDEAVKKATELLESGHNIDMGLGQINSANLSRLNLTVEKVFDPCANVQAASVVLEDAYKHARRKIDDPQEALSAALSIYNTGKLEAGISNGYVAKVREYAVPSLSSNSLKPEEKPEVVKVKASPKWDVFGGQRTGASMNMDKTEVENEKDNSENKRNVMVYGQ